MKHYTNADRADILHQASQLYMASNIPIDYGTGELFTPVEVHALKYIIDHPGKTVTELSRDWDKAKASVSQMMKKLEDKGLITRLPSPDSRRKQLYTATDQGIALNELHRAYDERVFGTTLAPLFERYSEDEIDACFRMLSEYCLARRRKHYRSQNERADKQQDA